VKLVFKSVYLKEKEFLLNDFYFSVGTSMLENSIKKKLIRLIFQNS